jgi:hypothetical protein
MQHNGQAVSLTARSEQIDPDFLTLQGKPTHTGRSAKKSKHNPICSP